MVLARSIKSELMIEYFATGADEVLSESLGADEFFARSLAVIRRSLGKAESRICVGRLLIDMDARTARIGSHLIKLTRMEYEILEVLALRQGKTVSRRYLLDHLYAGRDEPEAKILDVFVCRLRQKLKTYLEGESHIQTVWGVGYSMRLQVIDKAPGQPESVA